MICLQSPHTPTRCCPTPDLQDPLSIYHWKNLHTVQPGQTLFLKATRWLDCPHWMTDFPVDFRHRYLLLLLLLSCFSRWQPTRLPHPWDSPGKNTAYINWKQNKTKQNKTAQHESCELSFIWGKMTSMAKKTAPQIALGYQFWRGKGKDLY